MPLLKLQITETVSSEKKSAALSALSKIMTETLSKPETYVMAVIEQTDIIMSGKIGSAAFADIKSIGAINSETTSELTRKICAYLDKEFKIPSSRVYVNFSDIPGALWGWNGSTFG